MRQFERFYSALGRFQFDTFSSNFDIFSIKLSSILNCNGINIISCSKKVLGRHINQSCGSAFLKNPTKNTNSAIIQTTSLKDITLSIDVYPNLINLDNSLFPYSDITVSSAHDSHAQLLEAVTVSALNSTLLINSSVYALLIHLTIFNTQRPNF
jgi:hypothetical protein